MTQAEIHIVHDKLELLLTTLLNTPLIDWRHSRIMDYSNTDESKLREWTRHLVTTGSDGKNWKQILTSANILHKYLKGFSL